MSADLDNLAIAKSVFEAAVEGYAFATPADRSVWFAYALTVAFRNYARGPLPGFLFGALPGSDRLLNGGAAIGTGRSSHMFGAWPAEEQGQRVLIDRMLASGYPVASFAVPGRDLGSLCLATWLSATLPNRTVMTFTGSNVRVTIADRILVCHHELAAAPVPDSIATLLEEWASLTIAAGVLLGAYHASGGPDHHKDAFGGATFAHWDAHIRGAILWAGWADPCPVSSDIHA